LEHASSAHTSPHASHASQTCSSNSGSARLAAAWASPSKASSSSSSETQRELAAATAPQRSHPTTGSAWTARARAPCFRGDAPDEARGDAPDEARGDADIAPGGDSPRWQSTATHLWPTDRDAENLVTRL
jgi:hypothetical protein